jgi:hypothetical protein
MAHDFLQPLTGSFAMPAAENPTVAMIEAAYRHHGLNWRYINCEIAPDALGDAVRGARSMGWRGFNCSIPRENAGCGGISALGGNISHSSGHRHRRQRDLDRTLPQYRGNSGYRPRHSAAGNGRRRRHPQSTVDEIVGSRQGPRLQDG